MSRQNKIELKKELEIWYSDDFDSWYDSEYDDYDYYWDSYFDGWRYLPQVDSPLIYKIKCGRTFRLSGEPIIGKMIDMDSVYSKEIMRNLKIDRILGSDKYNPTFADIWNMTSKYENRNL